eukprot:9366052-Alexandrium_andersonii.AAC.1
MHSAAAVAGRDTVRNVFEQLCSSAQAIFERARHWTVSLVYQLSADQVWCPDYDRLYPINTLRNVALREAKAGL